MVNTIDWNGYVRLAFDELRLAGAYSPQVARRLRAALEDLKTVATPERQPVLDRQLDLLERLVSQIYEDEEEICASLTARPTGHRIRSGRHLHHRCPAERPSPQRRGRVEELKDGLSRCIAIRALFDPDHH